MHASFSNVVISGMSVAIPKTCLELSSLADIYGINEVDRIMSSTGISSIRIAEQGVKTSDLCYAAARNLLSAMNIEPSTLDGIVFVSQTSDAVMPATSVILQNRLSMSTNSVAFDINYGCSGYIYGLYQAAMLIKAGGCKRVLVCAGDVITPLIHPLDRHVRLVFGDAGCATIVERGISSMDFLIKTDGSGMNHLCVEKSSEVRQELLENIQDSRRGYLHMDGASVMEFVLREVPTMIKELLQLIHWKSEDVGTYALHQANAFILNYLRKKLAVSKAAVPIAVENTGNTGSASIPLVLSLTRDQLASQNRLNKVIMCGFGVGLSWASVGLDLSHTLIIPPMDF